VSRTDRNCTSWIQHPITGKLIPRHEYVRPTTERHFFAQGDFESFTSPVDGSLIDDRGKLRRHMKDHGITQSSDYSPEYYRKKELAREDARLGEGHAATQERKESIHRILEEYS